MRKSSAMHSRKICAFLRNEAFAFNNDSPGVLCHQAVQLVLAFSIQPYAAVSMCSTRCLRMPAEAWSAGLLQHCTSKQLKLFLISKPNVPLIGDSGFLLSGFVRLRKLDCGGSSRDLVAGMGAFVHRPGALQVSVVV